MAEGEQMQNVSGIGEEKVLRKSLTISLDIQYF